MEKKIKDRVITELNEHFGKDLKNLSKCKDLLKKWNDEKEKYEELLSGSSNTKAVKVIETIQSINSDCHLIEEKCQDITSILEKININSGEIDLVLGNVYSDINKIDELERTLIYLKVLDKINTLSVTIENYMKESEIESSIDLYTQLIYIHKTISTSRCVHLIRYINEVLIYWHTILKNRLSGDFSESLKKLRWPFINGVLFLQEYDEEILSEFRSQIRQLASIQLPTELNRTSHNVSSSLQVNFPELSLPIALMIQPLKKRFLYHFSGTKQTNRLDKPEWYFSQILDWLRNHTPWIKQWVAPVYFSECLNHDAYQELACGLVQLAVNKLQADLDQIQYDDILFSHAIDEALAFDKSLRFGTIYYNTELPSAVTVLTQASIFIKWINMERKYARDRVDSMIRSETAWSSDAEKITEVSRFFIAMLTAMAERYQDLPQPGHKLQFVELQTELVNDLRVSLLQLIRAESSEDPLSFKSKILPILNTVQYLITTLTEWDSNPNMLLLAHYKSQYSGNVANVNEENVEGIFENSISLLLRLENQLLKTISDAVMLEIKATSRPYRKERWHLMTEDDLGSNTLTPSGCFIYLALSTKLQYVEKNLTDSLFSKIWQTVAKEINLFLFEELILENTFTIEGAKVLEKDIEKCFLQFFYQYSTNPRPYFTDVLEACTLLTGPKLTSSLKKAVQTETNLELLKVISKKTPNLNLMNICKVLQRRRDVVIYDTNEVFD